MNTAIAGTMTTEELTALADLKIVDARGSACPGPLLEAKKGIATVPLGGIIEVWSSDPLTKADVNQWANKVGHGFLGALPADGYDRVFVRRGK
jgi:tRNA 2-thiouridine synthesizing protein A